MYSRSKQGLYDPDIHGVHLSWAIGQSVHADEALEALLSNLLRLGCNANTPVNLSVVPGIHLSQLHVIDLELSRTGDSCCCHHAP